MHTFTSGLYLIAPALTALFTIVSLRILDPVAMRLNLLDYPQGRKDHSCPTPVTGGLAMVMGSTGVVVALVLMGLLHVGPPLLGFILAGTLLVAVGLLDDLYDVRWWWRISAQVVAALLMVNLGGLRVEQLGQIVGLSGTGLGGFSIPFTVFATVGIINAVNMIDGIDGLAGSLVLAALVMLAAAALYAGNQGLAERTLILSGAVAGFLVWNVRHPWRDRAKVFMGNAGSAFLGLVIAWVSFRLTQTPRHPVSPILALWLLPIPIMDCLVLIVSRLRHARSPFAAGRDHLHHFMIDAGITPGWVAFWLTGFSLLCGLLIGQAMREDIPDSLLLLVFFAMCGFWYWLSSSRERAIHFFSRFALHSMDVSKKENDRSQLAPALGRSPDALEKASVTRHLPRLGTPATAIALAGREAAGRIPGARQRRPAAVGQARGAAAGLGRGALSAASDRSADQSAERRRRASVASPIGRRPGG